MQTPDQRHRTPDSRRVSTSGRRLSLSASGRRRISANGAPFRANGRRLSASARRLGVKRSPAKVTDGKENGDQGSVSFEDIAKLAKVACAELKSIWDTVGISADEQRMKLRTLKKQVANAFQHKIDVEKREKKKLMGKRTECHQRILVLRNELGLDSKGSSWQLSDLVPSDTALLLQIRALEAEIGDLNSTKEEWTVKIRVRLDALTLLASRLQEDLPPSFRRVGELSQGRLGEVEAKVEEFQCLFEQRQQAVNQCRKHIIALWHQLAQTPVTRQERLIQMGEDLGVTERTLASLQRQRKELMALCEARKTQSQALLLAVEGLWALLQVSDEEKRRFKDGLSPNELSSARVSDLEMELAKLKMQRQDSMGDIIGRVRAQMANLFDKLHLSPAQRSRYLSFNKAAIAMRGEGAVQLEELLDMMHADIESLKEKVASLRGIYANIAKREKYIKERAEYTALMKDSGRLLDRKRTGKMLQEENRMGKRVKSIPKLEDGLKFHITAWEREHGDVVMHNGVAFLANLEQQVGEYDTQVLADKTEKSERKKRMTMAEQQKRRTGSCYSSAKRKPKSSMTPGGRKKLSSARSLKFGGASAKKAARARSKTVAE